MKTNTLRLNGWKEIASYLGVSVRTAQVWERERTLPVRRPAGGRGGVYLLLSDLESWDSQGLHAEPVAVPSSRGAEKSSASRWLASAGVGLAVLVGWVGYLFGIGTYEPKLVALWDFEAGEGDRVLDRTGNGNDGILRAGTGVASSVAGGSRGLHLDGASSFVEIQMSAELNLEDRPFTITAWVKSAGGRDQDVWQTGVLPGGSEISLRLDGNGYAAIELHGDGHTGRLYTTSRQSLYDDRWHHLAAIRDRAIGSMILFVDGREVSRIADTDAVLRLGNGDSINIGRRVGGIPRRYFKGTIDQIGVYKGALSSDEIRALYDLEMPQPEPANACAPPPEGIVSWWDGDHTSDGIARDISRGYDAELKGQVSLSPGRVGKAFDLFPPGHLIVRDYPMPADSEFTVEGWILSEGRDNYYQAIINSGYAWNSPFDLRIGRVERNYQTDFLGCDLGTAALTFAVTTQEHGWSTADDLGACFTKREWHHVAATYDAAALKFYMDGMLQGEKEFAGTLIGPKRPLTIGWNYFESEYWTGKLDEITLYNRALAPSEIAAIYSAGELGKCKTPRPTRQAL